jgi:hypothetical protein
MDEDIPILSREHDRRTFNQVLAHYGAPAYVRRARQVEEALERLAVRCREVRDRWLLHVRLNLETLRLQAGDWQALRPHLADERQIAVLEQLHNELQAALRGRVEPTSSPRQLRQTLEKLVECIERFNRRWQEYLPTVDLTPVNAARDGYNRYYILEKECALRSPRLARLGFQRLEPMTAAELASMLPLLPIPQPAR